jgi:hypothetical protein
METDKIRFSKLFEKSKGIIKTQNKKQSAERLIVMSTEIDI